jgi:hypothetical protein
MLKLVYLQPGKRKRLRATFQNQRGKTLSIEFGDPNGSTYIDHHDKQKRFNYLKRHFPRENWNDPTTPGALSRWVLWGDYDTLEANLSAYLKRFRIST